MKRLVLLVLGVGLLLAADTPPKEAVKKEMEKLHGAWKVVTAETNGQTMPAAAFKNVVVTFADNTMTFKDGDKVYDEMTVELNPAKDPKTIDVLHTSGPKKGQQEKGIYALKGDQLRLCLAQPRQDRPATFSPKAGTGTQVYVLKRDKP